MAIYGLKNKTDILTGVMNALEKNAGISAIYPGSIARAFAEAFSSEVSDLYEAFRFSINQSNLSTASGRNLDLIGDLYGISRKTISETAVQDRQSFNIEFFMDKPHATDIVIPKLTLIFTDVSTFISRQYTYRLADDVTISAGSLRAYGRVEPNFSDNVYVAPINTLTKHNYLAPPSVTLFCTNPKEVYGMQNSESDNNYRRRIIASFKARPAGTAESVRFAALSVKGVRDVRIREASYGVGSCDVIIVPETLSTARPLPEAVLLAINEVKPVGVKFNVRIAERVHVGVSATIILNAGNTTATVTGVRRQAELFVKRYLNSLTIGESVSLSLIEQQIKSASDLIKSVTISMFTADGQELPLQDFNLNTVTKYPTAGTVSVNSVIISSSTY